MKKIVILLLLASAVLAYNNKLLTVLGKLTPLQKIVVVKAYQDGSRYDLGYTLAAIAWEESVLGKYKINLQDGRRYRFNGSYGVYHNLLKTVCDRKHIRTYHGANKVAQKLTSDINYASNEAITELLFWNKYWGDKGVKRKWSHIIASYNAGYKSINSTLGRRYRDRILDKIKVLKIYVRFYNIKSK